MLSVENDLKILQINESDATFTANKAAVSACDGMGSITADFRYTVAPAGAPTLEFSTNGVDWDYLQNIPAGVNPGAGIVAQYTIALAIDQWKFVRIVVQPPGAGGSCRGVATLLPKYARA